MCMSWTGFSVWLRSAALCDETEWYSLAGLQITAVVMSGLLQSRSLFSWLTHDPVHREEASRPHLASLLASSTMATSWWELFKQHCRKSNIHGALVPASHNPRPLHTSTCRCAAILRMVHPPFITTRSVWHRAASCHPCAGKYDCSDGGQCTAKP